MTIQVQLMIKSFKHKGLEEFFRTGKKTGIQTAHEKKLRIRLAVLDQARSIQDIRAFGWDFHALEGNLKGYFSISVSGNWRITFTIDESNDVILIDYLDYH